MGDVLDPRDLSKEHRRKKNPAYSAEYRYVRGSAHFITIAPSRARKVLLK